VRDTQCKADFWKWRLTKYMKATNKITRHMEHGPLGHQGVLDGDGRRFADLERKRTRRTDGQTRRRAGWTQHKAHFWKWRLYRCMDHTNRITSPMAEHWRRFADIEEKRMRIAA
jgi:hypothetical protein